MNLIELCHQFNLLVTGNISRITKIDPDAPVMISYWSSHACPAINYFKSHLLRHFHYLIEISLVLIWLLYVLSLDVGLRFNPFLILAIHCNRRRETLSTPKYRLINSKTGLLFLEFNCLSHRCKLCTDGRVIVESADKGKTWHVTIRLFVSVAHFELVVLLSDCFTVVPKSWA